MDPLQQPLQQEELHIECTQQAQDKQDEQDQVGEMDNLQLEDDETESPIPRPAKVYSVFIKQ